MVPGISLPSPLNGCHDVDTFDCGIDVFNEFIRRRAPIDRQSPNSHEYVVTRGGGRVVAYCSLGAGAVEAASNRDDIQRRERRRLTPVIVIARIAVEVANQRQGIGTALLERVALGCDRGATVFGARAAVATTPDERARSFFLNYGFEPFPGDPYRLYLPLDLPLDVTAGPAWPRGSCILV